MSLRLPFPSPEHRLDALSAYLDGELDLTDRLGLESWLASHSEDRDLLAELRALQEALGGLAPEPAPVPDGWTLRAYRIAVSFPKPGLAVPGAWATEALLGRRAQPQVVGHSEAPARRCVGRRSRTMRRGRAPGEPGTFS